MSTARPLQETRRLLCFDKPGCAIILFFLLLTVLAPHATEPWLASLDNNERLFMHVVLETLCTILAILTFTVGWQAFKTDRNWPMTLLAVLFLGSGALNINHLVSYLIAYLDLTPGNIAIPQRIAIFALSPRAFSALALLLAASMPAMQSISAYARRSLLAIVVALFTAIMAVGIFHPLTLSILFYNHETIAVRPGISYTLVGIFGAAAILFGYRFRLHQNNWLHHLMLASTMMLMAEINYMLPHFGRHTQPLIGHSLIFFAYLYVYRAIFLYSVQWPIEQMNDWKQRLKTSQRELAITKMAVENSGYYIFEFGDHENILYASDNACRRLGYRLEELIGLPVWKISGEVRDTTLSHDWSPLEERRHDASIRYESRLVTKSGESFPVAATTTCIVEDGKPHIYAVLEDITERKHFELQIAENEHYLRRLIDSIPAIISITTPEGIYVDYNQATLKNAHDIELRGRSLLESTKASLLQDSAKEAIDNAFAQARAGYPISLDLHVRILGEERYVDFSVAPVRDEAGNIVNLVTTATDITDRVLAQIQLKLASTVFDHSAEAILITDGNIHTLSINRAFTTITGFEQDEVLGKVPPLFEHGKHLQAMNTSLQESGNWSGEVEWLCKDGHLGYEWLTVTKVLDDEKSVCNYIVIFSDISERKRTEEHIQYLAYYDPLTNLPNRVLLEDRITQAIATAKRENHKIAIVFLDLDNFKTINDSLGHQHGDKILSGVAKRLKRSVREYDTVARLGGDEFIVVLTHLHEAEEAAVISRKLLDELALPYFSGNHELRLTVSVGVSIFPDDGEEFSRLIMNADAAMYYAKERGRNNVQFFIGEMNRRAAELLTLENQLRRAIERQEFVLHYQPQIDLRTGTIVGFEALVRWQDPEKGMIPPVQFIPLAEERGLVKDIGNWVLREACRQNRAWQDAGLPQLSIAVNISAKQFRDLDFVATVRCALRESGLEPRYLELEVTETAVMQDAESLISTLEELRQLGISLTIDDFGTGYSSLSYLKRFPIDKIKIDRSFVRDIPGDKDDHSIVRAIIGLSQQLNLKVVAEGVETLEQLTALQDSLCDHYQGYYFSKPVPAADAALLMRQPSYSQSSNFQI